MIFYEFLKWIYVTVHTKITFFSRRTKEERCPLTGILTYKITEKFFIRFAGGIRINFMLIPHRVKPHQVFCPMEELQSRSTGEWIFGFFLQIQVGGQALGTQRWSSRPLILFFAKHSSSFGISRLPKEPPAEALSCKQRPAKLCLLDKMILLTPANFPCKMLSNNTSWTPPVASSEPGLQSGGSFALQSCRRCLGRLRHFYSDFSFEAK